MDPTKVQGFNVKTTEEEKYLGMLITSSGVKEMVDINIKEKEVGPNLPSNQKYVKATKDIEDRKHEVCMFVDTSSVCPNPPLQL